MMPLSMALGGQYDRGNMRISPLAARKLGRLRGSPSTEIFEERDIRGAQCRTGCRLEIMV
jgi:hypothetical protein